MILDINGNGFNNQHQRQEKESAMKRTILLLFVIFLFLFTFISASASPEAFAELNGRPVYSLDCSGAGKDWNDCFKEAETLCPEGYNYTKKSLGAVSAQINGRFYITPSKELVVECR